MADFNELELLLQANQRNYDLPMIAKAYRLADEAHRGQVRKSGDAYITHPLAVAETLAEFGMDSESIVAAILHDVVEDTDVTLAQIKKEFSPEIAEIVNGVTKLGKIPFSSREEQQAENIRKMLLAMSADIRVMILKLADRLHNMRTLDFKTEQKQRDTALETMELYAPIAHRLGIRQIQEELEDISLSYLDPVAYHEIETLLAMEKEERNSFLNTIKSKTEERLSPTYKNIKIDGRVKSIYGIYLKVYAQSRAFDEIYDIYAIRIIVNTLNECYNVLGEIHDMFRPIPSRFKDYISTPKPNMYQSLHTTVIEKSGIPFEVQIRTWDMHNTAEYGIAAHWKYKEGVEGKDKLDEKISWVRQLLETQKGTVDAQEIVGSIKSDLSAEEVFVFTPKGAVITLPVGATVIDFAYSIHSEVGNRMIGAKIDGRMVSLDTKLQTGMIVNIITTNTPGHGPSRDWIKIVRTASTRNKIRSWFKKERRDENIAQGKAELEREFKRYNLSFTAEDLPEFLRKIAKSHHLNSIDDFYGAIGYGGISLSKSMQRIRDMYMRHYKTTSEEEMRKQLEKTASQRSKKASSGVLVEGLDGCLVKFSKCCSPLPGDDIAGYITRGFGVSIHRKDCVNAVGAVSDPLQSGRWVQCEWAEKIDGERFKSTVDIYGKDRPGLLVDVSTALNNMRIPVYALIAREQPDDATGIQITFGISDLAQLHHIMTSLSRISGISRVERTVQ